MGLLSFGLPRGACLSSTPSRSALGIGALGGAPVNIVRVCHPKSKPPVAPGSPRRPARVPESTPELPHLPSQVSGRLPGNLKHTAFQRASKGTSGYERGAAEGRNRLLRKEILGISLLRRMERETGIEPATNGLEGRDSTTELLPPREDGGGGWIRTTVGLCPADLQSAAFVHSATPPFDEVERRCRKEPPGGWSRHSESNRGPTVYKTVALPLSYAGRSAGVRRREAAAGLLRREVYRLAPWAANLPADGRRAAGPSPSLQRPAAAEDSRRLSAAAAPGPAAASRRPAPRPGCRGRWRGAGRR